MGLTPTPVSIPNSTDGSLDEARTQTGFAIPSLNSLGLSELVRDVSGTNPQTAPPAFASTPPMARDSVSSWGTADSMPFDGDLFSTLPPLPSGPVGSCLPPSELFSRPNGKYLSVVHTYFRSLHCPRSPFLFRVALRQLRHHN